MIPFRVPNELDIQKTISEIEQIFINQCMRGRQNTGLPPVALSCGQFLDDPGQKLGIVQPWNQRGLHGCAAALSVIAPLYHCGRNNANDVVSSVNGLIQYIISRQQVESSGDITRDKNEKNVIKISEILISIEHLRDADVTGPLISKYCPALLNGKSDSGWTYELPNGNVKSDATAELLPTAYVIKALSVCGKIVGNDLVIKSAMVMLENFAKRKCNIAELAICANSIFLLETCNSDVISGPFRDALRGYWKKIWRQIRKQMHSHYEANIEYMIEQKSHYVRVPFQLYAFALNRLFDVIWRGQSEKITSDILKEIKDSGVYVYPLSGTRISARTYSVLHLCLKLSLKNKPSWFRRWLSAVCVEVESSIVIKSAIIILLIVPIAISIYAATLSEGMMAGLGVNILSQLLIGLYIWNIER